MKINNDELKITGKDKKIQIQRKNDADHRLYQGGRLMKLNRYIDHTLLKANAVKADIKTLCEEAMTHEFASVCVNSCWVSYCREVLKNSRVKVCTVIGFPLGAMSTSAKAFEAKQAVLDGADELDMVINIGELKAGNYDAVQKDIEAVVTAAQDACVKVILENCLLSEAEIIKGCELCVAANADYVKTSTGFSEHGATVSDVKLMKEAVKGRCKVKAAGGISSYEEMMEMLEAGADRIGTSKGKKLLEPK